MWKKFGNLIWIVSITGIIVFSILLDSSSRNEADPNRRPKAIALAVFLVLFLLLFLASIYVQLEIVNNHPSNVLDKAHKKALDAMTPSFKYPEEYPLRGPHRVGLEKSVNWGENETRIISPRTTKYD